MKCNRCGKRRSSQAIGMHPNHFAEVCRQKLNTTLDRKPKHRPVKIVNKESDATQDESTEDEDPIFKIEEVSTVKTEGKQLLTKLQFLNQREQFVT